MTSTKQNGKVFNPANKGPKTFGELDVSRSLVEETMLRQAYKKHSTSLFSLCDSLKISIQLTLSIFNFFRDQGLVEVTGLNGHDYQFHLTEKGRSFAARILHSCQYVGPVPVSIESYTKTVLAQKSELSITRSLLRGAFQGLILTDDLLDQLGPALTTKSPIFLYGPSGNGKTMIASQLANIYGDTILVPYALEVDGKIIAIYDPAVHQSCDGEDAHNGDPRWVRCKRPHIKTGGELDPEMLNLGQDAVSKVYSAPLQLKANNGILVIDDFGRQSITPQALLNRLIVPLDQHVEYFTLKTGAKFQVPFDIQVVFATNLEPDCIGDEAFLRRIKNKIYVGPVRPEIFDQIFNQLVKERGLICEKSTAFFLRKLCNKMGVKQLQACVPEDILDIVTSIDRYEGRAPQLSADNIKRAASLYFSTSPSKNDEETGLEKGPTVSN